MIKAQSDNKTFFIDLPFKHIVKSLVNILGASSKPENREEKS